MSIVQPSLRGTGVQSAGRSGSERGSHHQGASVYPARSAWPDPTQSHQAYHLRTNKATTVYCWLFDSIARLDAVLYGFERSFNGNWPDGMMDGKTPAVALTTENRCKRNT
jgi:hypothetical protein